MAGNRKGKIILCNSILLAFFLLLSTSCEKVYIDDIDSDDIPEITPNDTLACTLHNGHVVVYSQIVHRDTIQLTLISLQEWTNLSSAHNTEDPGKSKKIAENYIEGDIKKWHVPTTEEAKRLRELYASSSVNTSSLDSTTYNNGFEINISSDPTPLMLLNNLLDSQQAEPITLTTGTINTRYLCDEGKKSFSFVMGTSISKAGAKAKTYRLRLLTTLSIPISKH